MNQKAGGKTILKSLLICVALAGWVSAAHAEDPVPQTVDAAHALVGKAFALAQTGDSAGAAQQMRLVLASPAFSKLAPDDQYNTWQVIGWAELRAHHPREALDMLKLACNSPVARAGAWMQRLAADQMLDDADGAETLLVIVQGAPKVLTDIDAQTIDWAANKSAKISDDEAIAVIGALRAAHWQNPDRYEQNDWIWMSLARAYLDKGDTQNAAAVMAGVTSVAPLIAARSEKLFDAAVAISPDHYDITKASSAAIAKYTEWTREDPNSLEAVNDLADSLSLANRLDEGLAVLDAAIARQKTAGSTPYTDVDKALNWTMNARARTLFALGRTDEALDAMKAGAEEKEGGSPNVSQTINLADYEISAGKPKDALATLATLNVNYASPYGRMAATAARVCAYAQMNDAQNLREQMTYMRTHSADAPSLMFEVFVCTGDLDSAAAAAAAQIRDPQTRSSMLMRMQNYLEPKASTPVDMQLRERVRLVGSRPEVAEAINTIGHVNTFPVLMPDM